MTRSALCLLALTTLSSCVVRTEGPPPGEPVYYPPPEPQPVYQPAPVVADEGPIFVPGAPPPPRQEYIPMAPGPNHYWVRGYWNWSGYQWDWVPGYWEYSEPGHIYVEPTYVIVNGRWEYRRGYWHDPAGRREYVRPYERRAPRDDWHRSAPPPAPGYGRAAPGGPVPPPRGYAPGPQPGRAAPVGPQPGRPAPQQPMSGRGPVAPGPQPQIGHASPMGGSASGRAQPGGPAPATGGAPQPAPAGGPRRGPAPGAKPAQPNNGTHRSPGN